MDHCPGAGCNAYCTKWQVQVCDTVQVDGAPWGCVMTGDAGARSDADLLAGTRQHPELFAVVYRRHVDAVLAFALSRLGDRQLAADVTAETFAQALVSATNFREDKTEHEATARPWLMGIARHLIARTVRNGRVERRARRRLGVPHLSLTDEDYQRVEARLDAREHGSTLIAAMADLSEPPRRAVQLRVLEQRPYAEVAATLGCSTGAARVRVSRALRELARALHQREEPGEPDSSDVPANPSVPDRGVQP